MGLRGTEGDLGVHRRREASIALMSGLPQEPLNSHLGPGSAWYLLQAMPRVESFQFGLAAVPAGLLIWILRPPFISVLRLPHPQFCHGKEQKCPGRASPGWQACPRFPGRKHLRARWGPCIPAQHTCPQLFPQDLPPVGHSCCRLPSESGSGTETAAGWATLCPLTGLCERPAGHREPLSPPGLESGT